MKFRIDKYLLPKADELAFITIKEDAEFHIEDCKENPTIGLLARQNERTNDYPKMRKHNLNILNNVDSFKKNL